jgi:cytochrome c peroxidase
MGLRPGAWALSGLVLLCTSLATAGPANQAGVNFSPAELQAIRAHGPWPPARAQDPGNAQSGNKAAIAFGQQLFFDLRLSKDASLACASCHIPGLAFADGRARSVGREVLDRNAPSLWNAVHERWMGWDGAADSIWSQSIRPLLDPREMASSAQAIAESIASDKSLSCRYRQVYQQDPLQDPQTTLVNAAKAIAAFTATLVSGRTPFDAFRDALNNKAKVKPPYPLSAQRGLQLFVGRGQCTLCHVGPMFSNGEFADTGLPFFIKPGVVDPGRHQGITDLQASAYNLMSRWSDDPEGVITVKTRQVDLQHRNFGEFKVPGLRNVAVTAPYMHNGQLRTLPEVVRHYSELNLDRLHADGEQILKPLRLTQREAADLVSFLTTLTDRNATRWKPPVLRACNLKSTAP